MPSIAEGAALRSVVHPAQVQITPSLIYEEYHQPQPVRAQGQITTTETSGNYYDTIQEHLSPGAHKFAFI